MDQNKMKAVYTILERGEGKSYWMRIGIAFENRDGSFNLKLDALPLNGQLQMREFDPREEGRGPTPGGRPVERSDRPRRDNFQAQAGG